MKNTYYNADTVVHQMCLYCAVGNDIITDIDGLKEVISKRLQLSCYHPSWGGQRLGNVLVNYLFMCSYAYVTTFCY